MSEIEDETYVAAIGEARKQKAAENSLVVIDSSTLRIMAAPISHDYIEDESLWDNHPTLLEFIRKILDAGVHVIIPETVVFETIGQDRHGTQLVEIFLRDPEFPFIKDFIAELKRDYDNFEVRSGEEGETKMDVFRSLEGDKEAFKHFKRQVRKDMADDDIVELTTRDRHEGFVFVVTDDKSLKESLPDAQNEAGFPITRLNSLSFVSEVSKIHPIDGVEMVMDLEEVRNMMNEEVARLNQFRAHNGRDEIWKMSQEPRQRISEGGIPFAEALHRINEASRGNGLVL